MSAQRDRAFDENEREEISEIVDEVREEDTGRTETSRRKFLKGMGVAAAGFTAGDLVYGSLTDEAEAAVAPTKNTIASQQYPLFDLYVEDAYLGSELANFARMGETVGKGMTADGTPQGGFLGMATPMPHGSLKSTVAEYNGNAIITSGVRSYSANEIAGTFEFDPHTQTYTKRTKFPRSWVHAPGVSIGDKIYIPGGDDFGGTVYGDVEIYDIPNDTWSTGATKPTPVDSYQSTAYDGKVHVFSGSDSNNTTTTAYEIYDPSTDSWSSGPSMPHGVVYASAVTHEGKAYIIGGDNGNDKNPRDLMIYDFESGSYTVPSPTNPPSYYGGIEESAADIIDGNIYIIGGPDVTNISSSYVVEYNIQDTTFYWKEGPAYPINDLAHSFPELGDGCRYLFGGYLTSTTPLVFEVGT